MLLQLPEGMLIDHIQATDTGLLIAVTATALTSRCPLCGEVSSSVHSSYCRSVRDVPCGGRRVQLCLMVRKFFCRNALCERKVFTEQLPSFVEPWARMTMRLCQALQAIGLATSGKGGTRLARRLSMHTSRQTVLRRVMDLPSVPTPSVLYLGVDDFSFRRGQWFGTILVDIERHRVIDVLPDRRAETVARWMRLRPEITVVSRDRGGEYASAAREGAPQALQCADRFHVVKNLTEAVQVLLARCQAEILAEKKPDELGQDEQNKPILSIEEWRPPEPAHVEKVRLARRAGRHARYEQVIELRQQGMKPQDIACQLGLSERTVRRWLAARAFPEARKRRKRQSSFDDFAPYILKRWQSGEHNGLVLWREIMAQGYTGTARSVYRHLETLKRVEVKASVNLERIQKYSPSTAVWLFVRDPHKLDTVEREDLVAYCQASSALSRAYQFTQEFLTMVHKREGDRLDAWLEQVSTSDLPELQSFASGIERDKTAVQAGLTWWVNNGQVEGQVTKLKLIKRQMYGRAGFALLRQRVLHAV